MKIGMETPVEKISNRQLMLILLLIRSTAVIAFLPVLTSADAMQDAWASAVLTLVGTVFIALIIGGLGTRFPGMTVVEYSQFLLGKWLGRFISLIYLWAFLWIAAVEIRIYGEVIILGFLDETPLVFISGGMVLAAAFAAYGGIEVIGRAADFLGPIFIATMTATLLSLIPNASPEWLQPVLSRGVRPVLRGSIVPIVLGAYLLVLAILIPSTEAPKKATRSALVAVTCASLLLIATALVVVTTIGPYTGARSFFPLFKAIRATELSEFLERIEMFMILSWGLGLFIGISTFLYCGAKGIQQLLGLKSYRPLIAPMTVVWTALSIHAFENIFQMETFIQPHIVGPYYTSLILIPTLLLWLGYMVAALRGKLPKAGKKDEKT